MTPVKHQWHCASFGGFDHEFITTGNLSPLSEQQLVNLQIFKRHVDVTHTTNAQYASHNLRSNELVDLANPDNVCYGL